MNWKKGVLIGLLAVLLLAALSGCLQEPEPTQADLKYCETPDDCETSCGGKIGRGDCFNKAFVSFDNPPDGTCCACEYCGPCFGCECIDNVCTRKEEPEPDRDCC